MSIILIDDRVNRKCIVKGCNSTNITPGITLFRLPQDERRNDWFKAVDREDLVSSKSMNHFFCHLHFDSKNIRNTPSRKILTRNAIPISLNKHHNALTDETTSHMDLMILDSENQNSEGNLNLIMDNDPLDIESQDYSKLHQEIEIKTEKQDCQINFCMEEDSDDDTDEIYVEIKEQSNFVPQPVKYFIQPKTLPAKQQTVQLETLYTDTQPISSIIMNNSVQNSSVGQSQSSMIKANQNYIDLNQYPEKTQYCSDVQQSLPYTTSNSVLSTQVSGHKAVNLHPKPMNTFRVGTGNRFLVTIKEDDCSQTDQVMMQTQPSSSTEIFQLQGQPISTQKVQLKPNKKRQRKKKTEVDNFVTLCRKYLHPNLARLLYTQLYMKQFDVVRSSVGHLLCIQLYYNRPLAYRLLQKSLKLPSIRTLLKYSEPVGTLVNFKLLRILQAKVNGMTDQEKYCSVAIGSFKLKPNLYYNIGRDAIVGFQEFNNVQTPTPAKYAIVVIVRGIFSKWEQPVGYALVSECKNTDHLTIWINNTLQQLAELGLNFCSFVSDFECDFWNAKQFIVNRRKVYYLFDPNALMNSVYNCLMTHDLHYNGLIVKWEHILQFYENDKNKILKLAPKLTDKHINPRNLETIKENHATDVLSHTVAAGISFYVDHNKIDQSARDTVKFLSTLHNLYNMLTTTSANNSDEYKQGFCGRKSQVSFFKYAKEMFASMIVINKQSGIDVTQSIKFIEAFQITITSLLLILDELKQAGFKYLCTKRLNQNLLSCFNDMKTKSGSMLVPTSRQFSSIFKKALFKKIVVTSQKPCQATDVSDILIEVEKYVDDVKRNKETVSMLLSDKKYHVTSSGPKVLTSDYKYLSIPDTDPILYNCEFLLMKCLEKHDKCYIFKKFTEFNENYVSLKNLYTRYRMHLANNGKRLSIVPTDNFIACVEQMELRFRKKFDSSFVGNGILKDIYDSMIDVGFYQPCECFPIVYMKKLYIRMRIHFAIKFHNRAFRHI